MSEGTHPGAHPPAQARPTEPDAVENGNRRWKRWEVGALLTGLDEGEQIEDVSHQLHRSPDAARRQFERLLAGRTACPDEYGQALEALRVRTQSRPRGGRGRSVPHEQYVVLARKLEQIADQIAHLRTGSTIVLAAMIAAGQVRMDALRGVLTPDGMRAVGALARDLSTATPGASDEPHAAAPADAPACDADAPGAAS